MAFNYVRIWVLASVWTYVLLCFSSAAANGDGKCDNKKQNFRESNQSTRVCINIVNFYIRTWISLCILWHLCPHPIWVALTLVEQYYIRILLVVLANWRQVHHPAMSRKQRLPRQKNPPKGMAEGAAWRRAGWNPVVHGCQACDNEWARIQPGPGPGSGSD